MKPSLAALLLLIALAAAPAVAGEVIVLDGNDAFPDHQRIRATFEPTPPSSRPGAYGFIHVKLDNPDSRAAHMIQVEAQGEHGNVLGRFRASAVVPAGESATVYLPIPGGTDWCYIRAVADGRQQGNDRSKFLSISGKTNVAVLGIQDAVAAWRSGASSPHATWREVLKRSSTPSAQLYWRQASEVPASFALLTGFDLILLGARASDVPDAVQRALVQYVAAGGHLVIANAGPTLEGALSSLETSLARESPKARRAGARSGTHGLGMWLGLPGALPTDEVFGDWWSEQVTSRGIDRRHAGGGQPPLLWMPLEIPGLGQVPVLAFFLLLLLFAVVAGPVSYVLFKRRRKLAWLLVTIPATGFLFSAAILLYGFFSEGFGISGTARSFTMLDQRTHDAVVAAGRSLYAGLPVAAIEPGADTFLGVHVRGRRDEPPVRLEANLDGGMRLDGVALPSRTPTTFVTTTVGRVRDRLRFKRLEDGTYDVLAGPGFAPVAAEGALLLRTSEGGYFLRSGSGRLVPLGSRNPRKAIDDLLHPMADAPLDQQSLDYNTRRVIRRLTIPGPNPSMPSDASEEAWAGLRVRGGLPRGSYLARIQSLAALDDLGLDVDLRAAEHVVLGLLDTEDVLE